MLIDTFFREARELLQGVAQNLLQLEREPGNVLLLDEIFRAAHTLKGSAGVVGLTTIQAVAHALEDLLERLRSGAVNCSPELIDVALAGFDAVQLLVDAAEKNEEEPPVSVDEIITRIERFSPKEHAATPAEADSSITGGLDRERLAHLPPGVYREILSHLERQTKVYQIAVDPAPEIFYSGLDPLRIWREAVAMGTLLHFEVTADALPPLQELNPEYCYLSFSGYLAGNFDRPVLEEAFAFLASETSRVRLHELTWPDLVCAYESQSEAPWEMSLPGDLLREVLDALSEIKGMASAPVGEMEPADWKRLLLSLENLKHRLVVLVDALAQNSPPYRVAANLYLLGTLLTHRLQSSQPGTAVAGLLKDICAVFDAHTAALQAGTYPDLDIPGMVRDLLEWTPSPGAEDSVHLDEPTVTAFLALLTQQKEYLTSRQDLASFSGDARVICHLLEQSARHLGWPWLHDQVKLLAQDLTTGTLTAEKITGLLDEITAKIQVKDLAGSPEPPAVGLPKPAQPESKGRGQEIPPAGVLQAEDRRRVVTETIKVEQGQVDRLMNLAGELVVAKNSLPFLAREIEGAGLPLLARQLKDNYLLFERLVKELQDTVMDIRMLPVAYVFEKFPRFVRDTARALGKRVKLLIEGEETRLDKGVIEGLNDPLVHLVRNALDHGLEPETERLRLGKQPEGLLVLRAAGQGDRVVIEVADDGRGMDPDLIRAAAVARGLLGQAEAAALSDEAVLQLVFRPGFSTAERVTGLSGRGVGMDVVATSVQRLKGRVDIQSRVGEGTTVRLELPLTMATSKVLLVTGGHYLYGLPLEAVRETVKVPRCNIRTLKGREVFLWRGKLLPLLRLGHMLGLNGSAPEEVSDEEYIVVLRQGAGLVVSDVVGEQEIILKPLNGELAMIRIYLGAAILGDGSVLLVLDPRKLVREGG